MKSTTAPKWVLEKIIEDGRYTELKRENNVKSVLIFSHIEKDFLEVVYNITNGEIIAFDKTTSATDHEKQLAKEAHAR